MLFHALYFLFYHFPFVLLLSFVSPDGLGPFPFPFPGQQPKVTNTFSPWPFPTHPIPHGFVTEPIFWEVSFLVFAPGP